MSTKKQINLASLASKVLSLTSIALACSSIFFSNISVNAQLGLEPFGINKSDPKETGWFKYSVDPGSTIDDFVVVSNVGAEDTNVDLRSNDAVTTEDGAFTIVSNDLPNKEVGKWIDIKENILTVPAGKALKVPFKIQVPADAKPGEYAGGLSITEVDKPDGTASPLSVKTRIGNRIYLTVKGDQTVSTSVKDLSILNPKTDNFGDELRKRAFIKPENLVFKFTAENTGTVYTTLNGSFKIAQPDGKVLNQTFTRNLTPRNGSKIFYIETSVPYQVGQTVLNLEYSTKPQNAPKDGDNTKFNYSNDKGALDFTLNLTSAELDQFAKMVAKPEQTKPVKNNNQVAASTQPLISGSAEAPKTVEKEVVKEVPADNSMVIYVGIGLGLLLLLLIALVGYKIMTDKKSKEVNKTEKK
jgi:hypothetical protein